jgi:hypothetical protein
MLKRHANALRRALRNGKGYRFTSSKIEGGSFKSFARDIKSFANSSAKKVKRFAVKNSDVVLNEVIKPAGEKLLKTGRKIGHNMVKKAVLQARNNGYDVKDFAPLAHELIDSNNVNDLKKLGDHAEQVAVKRIVKEGVKYASEKMKQHYGNGLTMSNGLEIESGIHKPTGLRLPTKGSQEAKDRMSRVRAMKGNGILKDIKKFGRTKVGRILKHVGKTVLKGVANVAVDGVASYALGNPLAGALVGSVINKPINKQIDGLGIGNYINANAGGGDGTLLRRSVPRKKSGAVRGGSFISY